MEKTEARSMALGGNDRLKVLNDEIQKLMDMEECMWNQQSKTDWLHYGDQNTKGLFGFAISITHNSVSITYNSKYVGPMKKNSIWICFQVLFLLLNSLIF